MHILDFLHVACCSPCGKQDVFNKVEILLVLIHILESVLKFSPQLFQNIRKSSVAEGLLQRWDTCGDSSKFGELNAFYQVCTGQLFCSEML